MIEERNFDIIKNSPHSKNTYLISEDQPVVEGYYREDKKLWRISNAVGLDSSIQVYSLNCEIALRDIYAFISFSGDAQIKLDL